MEESTKLCKNCKRKVFAANFASHSAFCERRIKLCDVCDEPVPIAEFKEHEDEYHAMIACEKCDEPLQKWMLPKHEESCSKRLVPCEFCEAEFPYDKYPEHKEFCGSKTEKCIYCKNYIMMKQKEAHYEAHRNDIKRVKEIVKDEADQISAYEAHKSAIRRLKDNELMDEVDQNSINEVINNTGLVFQTKKYSQAQEHCGRELQQSESAVSRSDRIISENKQNSSKHYGICQICKERIRWVDMNTHVPACASRSGKCSRCGDDVPPSEIKDHILKYCRKLKEGTVSASSSKKCSLCEDYVPSRELNDHLLKYCRKLKEVPLVDPDEEMVASGRNSYYETSVWNYSVPIESKPTKLCPFCEQVCDEERILEHIKTCEKNTYECPLCLKILPEKERERHMNFMCEVLLDIQSPVLDTSTNQSYAESVKKCKRSHNVESRARYSNEACPICRNSFPKNLMMEHVQICQVNMKPCKFCGKFIPKEKERNHLINCPGVETDVPHYKYRAQEKGAVPKYSDQSRMSQEPESVDCRKCSECGNYVPVKCFEAHERQHKQKKNHHCGRGMQKKEEHGQSAFKKVWNSIKSYTGHEVKDNAYFDKGTSRSDYSSDRNTYTSYSERPGVGSSYGSYSNQLDGSLYSPRVSGQEAFDPLIPCEFCEQNFPMSEIVLHSTGCQPDLCTKKPDHTSDERRINKLDSHRQKNPVTESRLLSSDKSTFFQGVTPASSSRRERLRQSTDPSIRPGEFLNDTKRDVRHVSKYENAEPEVDQDHGEEYTKPPKVMTLWNFAGSSSNELPDDEIPDIASETTEKHTKENENAAQIYFSSHEKVYEGDQNYSAPPRSLSSQEKGYDNAGNDVEAVKTSSDIEALEAFSDTKDDIDVYLSYLSVKVPKVYEGESSEKLQSTENINLIANKRMTDTYEEELLPKHQSSRNVNNLRSKEVSDLYDEEEPKMNKSSEVEHRYMGLKQAYSSKVKEPLSDSDSESESLDSAVEASKTFELKQSTDTIRMQLHTEKDKIDVDSILPEDIDLNKEKWASTKESGMMNVDSTSTEHAHSNEQRKAFRIEPAVQSFSLEQKMNKKTWKIEDFRSKIADGDSLKEDASKQCFANFRFGMNRDVTHSENRMECEDNSVKDENENQELPSNVIPVGKPLKNGSSREKIAANFYDYIEGSHKNFVELAQKKLCGDQKRSSAESNDERPSVNDWIKKQSRRSSDSE